MTEHVLHIAKLNNNCPVCYTTDGLEISFTQNEKETRFYNKADKEISETIYCHTCKNVIYPVDWNSDIERIYDYHKKQVTPINSMFKPKPILYLSILIVVIILAGLVYILGAS